MFPQIPFGFLNNIQIKKGVSSLSLSEIGSTTSIGEPKLLESSINISNLTTIAYVNEPKELDSLINITDFLSNTSGIVVSQALSNINLTDLILETNMFKVDGINWRTLTNDQWRTLTDDQWRVIRDSDFPMTDPDAANVITAIEATGVTLSSGQKTSIDNRIISAKADGVWTKWVAYYGLVGGTAAAHAINWKNPSTYLITWNGTTTHNATGVTGNGVNGYGETGISPASVLSSSNAGLGFYLTSNKGSDLTVDMGASDSLSTKVLSVYIYGGIQYLDVRTGGVISTLSTGNKQYASGNNIGTTGTIYSNGSPISSGTTSTWTLPSDTIGLMRFNAPNPFYSTSSYGSFSINTGLTSAEETANYISELAFQTTLGRN